MEIFPATSLHRLGCYSYSPVGLIHAAVEAEALEEYARKSDSPDLTSRAKAANQRLGLEVPNLGQSQGGGDVDVDVLNLLVPLGRIRGCAEVGYGRLD